MTMETSWSMARLPWRYADVTSPSREFHLRHEPSRWAEGMSSPERTVIAVAAGLAAGCSFGTGLALQYRQAQLARGGARTPVWLLAHLARQRLWLAGNALGVAGLRLPGPGHGLRPAGARGPGGATDLLFALPLAAHWVLAFAAVGLVSATAVAAAGRTRSTARASLLVLAGATWLAADARAGRILSGPNCLAERDVSPERVLLMPDEAEDKSESSPANCGGERYGSTEGSR